jgi:hypothetical protein
MGPKAFFIFSRQKNRKFYKRQLPIIFEIARKKAQKATLLAIP